MFDKAKLKLLLSLMEELAPELEFRIIEKAKIKLKGEEPKEWMCFLIREKKKDESVLRGSTEASSEGKER